MGILPQFVGSVRRTSGDSDCERTVVQFLSTPSRFSLSRKIAGRVPFGTSYQSPLWGTAHRPYPEKSPTGHRGRFGNLFPFLYPPPFRGYGVSGTLKKPTALPLSLAVWYIDAKQHNNEQLPEKLTAELFCCPRCKTAVKVDSDSIKPGSEHKCPKCGLILRGRDDLRKAATDRLSKFPKVIKPKH